MSHTSLSITRWGNATFEVRARLPLPNCYKANLLKTKYFPSFYSLFPQRWKWVSLNAIYSFLYVLEKTPRTLRPTSGKRNFSKTIIHTGQNTSFAANGPSDISLSTPCLICEDQSVIKKCDVREINNVKLQQQC